MRYASSIIYHTLIHMIMIYNMIHFLGILQLREEFDNGLRDSFSEEDNAHDVAALFKEFIRCLPEPLLTRELYTSFLSTQSMYCNNVIRFIFALCYVLVMSKALNYDFLTVPLCIILFGNLTRDDFNDNFQRNMLLQQNFVKN